MLTEILTCLYSSTIDLQLRAEHLGVLLIDRDDTADNDDNDVTENIGPGGHWPLLPMCLTRGRHLWPLTSALSGPVPLVTSEGGLSDSQETSAMPAMSTEATTQTSACRYNRV